MKSQKSKIASLVLRIGVAVGACFLIFKDLDFGQLYKNLLSLHWGVLLFAVGMQYLSQILMAFRWWVMLRTLGIYIPFFTTLHLHFHGLFFNNFLPGSIGGDFIRAWYVTKHHESKRLQSAMSVFVDRFTGLGSTLIIAITCYFCFMRGAKLLTRENREGFFTKLYTYEMELLYVLAGLIAVAVLVFVIPKTRKMIFSGVRKLCDLAKHGFGQFLELVSVYVRKPWIGPFAFGLTILFQCLIFTSYWLIGRDLGVSDEIRYYFVFFPFVWVMGSIPVSVAGIGILEGGLILLFVTFAGADKEAATALALCQRALMLMGSLPGIWIHLRATHLPKEEPEFSVDEKSSIQ